MNPRQIEVFHAVMSAGSVTGAANALNVSQPSVSKTIRHLESRINFKLFLRIKGRLVPTPEAEALHSEVSRVFLGMKSIQNIVEELRLGRTGMLRIASTAALGSDFLPRRLASFESERPDVGISFLVRPVDQVAELLASQQIDLGFALFFRSTPSVKSEDLLMGRMVCAVHPDHPLSELSMIAPDDLSGHRIVTYELTEPFGEMTDRVLKSAASPPKIVTRVELGSTACSLVRYNNSAALVDQFTPPGFDDLKIVPLENSPEFAVNLLTPAYRPNSILANDFVAHIRKTLG